MMESILALIDKRIAFAEEMRRTRPHEYTQWTIAQKQFETLREEVAQGLHDTDAT